jgi:solute carrier family 39 (zinc transporter), member 1/2/3
MGTSTAFGTFVRQDDHDHGHNDEGIVAAKTTAMIVLFAASAIFGLLPFKLAQRFKWTEQSVDARKSRTVSVLLSFGGGVLLSTTFLHLLPEVTESIASLQSRGHIADVDFHLAPLLMCVGFFFIYFVEEVVHVYLHKKEKKVNSANSNGNAGHHHTHVDLEVAKGGEASEEIDHTNTHCHVVLPLTKDESLLISLRGLLIVLALSVHELFEGLAVGLESDTSGVWYLFGAVASHKLVIAFCVGVELVVNKTKFWLAFAYIFTYAVVSPVGIGIGILISNSESETNSAVISVFLQGLASGTLLYVVFFEILAKYRSGLVQYAAVFVGFFLMFGLKFLSESTLSCSIQ